MIEKPYRDHLVSCRIGMSHVAFLRCFKNKPLHLMCYCPSKYATKILRNKAACREKNRPDKLFSEFILFSMCCHLYLAAFRNTNPRWVHHDIHVPQTVVRFFLSNLDVSILLRSLLIFLLSSNTSIRS